MISKDNNKSEPQKVLDEIMIIIMHTVTEVSAMIQNNGFLFTKLERTLTQHSMQLGEGILNEVEFVEQKTIVLESLQKLQ